MDIFEAGNSYPRKFHILSAFLPELSDLVGYEVFLDLMEKRGLFRLEGDLLEVGCFIGGGTAKLAKAAEPLGKKVYAVDVFEPACDRTVNMAGISMADLYMWILNGREQEALFYENTRECGNVVVLKVDSRNLQFEKDQKFIFAFIDGNHEPAIVRNDFEKVWPHIISGGVLGFHDYGGDLPETTSAIDQLVSQNRSHIAGIETIPGRWILFLFKK